MRAWEIISESGEVVDVVYYASTATAGEVRDAEGAAFVRVANRPKIVTDRIRQGRCDRCRIRVTWPNRRGPLRGARCPRCEGPLERTTHLVKLPTEHWSQGPNYREEAHR